MIDLDVTPVNTVADQRDVGLTNPELFCQRHLSNASSIFATYRPYVSLGQRRRKPLFFVAILHVVLMRSKEQMRGIAARWIIARMENMQPKWRFSSHKFPRVAVRENTLSLLARHSPAIAFMVNMFRPRPATFRPARFIDVIPKIINDPCFPWSLNHAHLCLSKEGGLS